MIKRFAFWPLLAIACVAAVGAVSGYKSYAGAVIGLVISVPLAVLVDRRRQRRWAAGGARRLFP